MLSAEAQAQRIDFRADSTSYAAGSPVRMTFEARLPGSVEVLWPAPPDTFPSGLEVLKVLPPEAYPEGNLKVHRRTWIAMGFMPDTFSVPPQKVRWRNVAGDTLSITTRGLKIPVRIMPVDTTAPLSALDPPLSLPYDWDDYKYYLMAVLLLAAVIYSILFYYRLWNKKREEAPVARPMPVESPYIIAMRELNALREKRAWDTMESKAYYEKLTDVLRQYIHRRMHLPALESTTSELLDQLAYASFAAELFPVQHLFQTADLAKFARYQPGPEEAVRQLEAATSWIEAQEQRHQAEEESQARIENAQKPVA